MANKNITLQDNSGNNLYPTTTPSQVSGLSALLVKDATPTSGSTNAVESGGVYTIVSEHETKLNTLKTMVNKKTSAPKTTSTALGANYGAYTPTKSGFIVARSTGYTDGSYARIKLSSDTNNVLASNIQYTSTSRGYNPCGSFICPVCAGVTYYLQSSGNYKFYFYPDAGGEISW